MAFRMKKSDSPARAKQAENTQSRSMASFHLPMWMSALRVSQRLSAASHRSIVDRRVGWRRTTWPTHERASGSQVSHHGSVVIQRAAWVTIAGDAMAANRPARWQPE